MKNSFPALLVLAVSACEMDLYVADCTEECDEEVDDIPPPNDLCEAATALVLPLDGEELVVAGTTRAAEDEREPDRVGFCSFIEGAADVFFALRVEEGVAGVVEARVDVLPPLWGAIVYTTGATCDAASTSECVREDWHHASAINANEPLMLVVDGAGPDLAGDFEMSLRFAHAIDGAETCDAAPSINDVGRRGRLTMNVTDAVDDIERCASETSFGDDIVYAVTLSPNETLHAQYEYPILLQGAQFAAGLRAPRLYVLDTCADDAACVAASNPPDVAEPAALTVTNETTSPKTYYLVLDDVIPTASAQFILSWSID
jgi:hypothetical protein